MKKYLYYFLFIITTAFSSCNGTLLEDIPAEDIVSITTSAIVTDVTADSVIIFWITNIPTTHQVEYGTVSETYTDITAQSVAETESHTVTITGLATDTYYFRVLNYSTIADDAVSTESSFATSTTLSVSAITANATSDTTAAITWTTNVSTTHVVEYGTASGNYTFATVESDTPSTSHTVNLTGLTGDTLYYYRVKNFHATYEDLVSTEDSFTTDEETHPNLAEKLRGIWIIGGASTYAGGTFYPEIDLYDPVTATWYPDVAAAASGTAPAGLAFPMVASVNSKIYIIGGASTTTTTSSATYEYDVINNSWSLKTPINNPSPVALMDAAVYVHGGKIHLMGGTTGVTAAGVVTTHYQYNPANGTWITLLAVPAGRCGMAAYNNNGLISYAVGRIITTGAPSALNDIYMFNQNAYTTTNPNITEQAFTAVFGAAYAGYSGTNGTYFFIVGGATNTIATYFSMASTPTYILGANSWQVYTPPASANGRLVAQNSTYYHPAWLSGDTGIVFAGAVVSPYRSGSSANDPTLYVFGGIKNGTTVTNDYYYLSANGTVSGANYIITTAWTGDNGGVTKMPRVRYGHRAITINQ